MNFEVRRNFRIFEIKKNLAILIIIYNLKIFMKTNKKIFFMVSQTIISIFFLLFLYFSYFSIKELLVLNNVSNTEYVAKFYSYKTEMCENIWNNFNYYEEKIPLSEIKKDKENCLRSLENFAENKKVADFKYNFIKYFLATLFSLILFIFFAISNLFFIKENLCKKNN